MNKPKIFNIGGMWEEKEWEIHFNVKCPVYTDNDLLNGCPHCSEVFSETLPANQYHNERIDRYFICPRVVIAVNEGGHNSTGVCLDCILEAAKEIAMEQNK